MDIDKQTAIGYFVIGFVFWMGAIIQKGIDPLLAFFAVIFVVAGLLNLVTSNR